MKGEGTRLRACAIDCKGKIIKIADGFLGLENFSVDPNRDRVLYTADTSDVLPAGAARYPLRIFDLEQGKVVETINTGNYFPGRNAWSASGVIAFRSAHPLPEQNNLKRKIYVMKLEE